MTKGEKETIIIFNEAEANATIYSCTSAIWNRCEKLGLKPTNEIKRISKTYECPKKWIKIRKPRKLTEADLEKLRERGRALAQHRK